MFIGAIKQYSNIIILVVSLILFGLYSYGIYHFGYSNANNKATAKYEKTISDINAKSAKLLQDKIDEYNKFVEEQDRLTNQLLQKNSDLEKLLKENQDEANKDPNADKSAIGAPSVMRLNRIR